MMVKKFFGAVTNVGRRTARGASIHTTAGEERAFLRMVIEHSCPGLGDPARVGVQKVGV